MKYPTPARWRCRVVSVHDGDTLVVTIDRGMDDSSVRAIRLRDVWAPELSQPGGFETRDFVLGWLHDHDDGSAWPFELETFRTPRSDVDVMTFDRYVGELRSTLAVLNVDVQAFVVDSGFGGGTGS